MLEANKSAWFESLFSAYNRNLLRRRFASLRVSGIANLSTGSPSIVIANHVSWWDGLVCQLIFRHLGIDGFVMMEEANLRRYPLFRRIGAFSVDRRDARSALRSIEYAARLLSDRAPRSVLIFPQGKIEPEDRSPISFESGIVRLIERAKDCRVVPLAVCYRHRDQFKPEIFVSIADPIEWRDAANSTVSDLSAVLDAQLARLRQDLATDSINDYTEILR